MTRLAQYIEAAESGNTRRSYASAILHFEVEWKGLLPSTADAIARYLADQAPTLAHNTLRLRLAALSRWHTDQGFPDPTKSALVRQVLKGIRSVHSVPEKRARPLELSVLQQVDQWLDTAITNAQRSGNQSTALRHARDRSLILLGFWRGFSHLHSAKGDLSRRLALVKDSKQVNIRQAILTAWAAQDVVLPTRTDAHCKQGIFLTLSVVLGTWTDASHQLLTLAGQLSLLRCSGLEVSAQLFPAMVRRGVGFNSGVIMFPLHFARAVTLGTHLPKADEAFRLFNEDVHQRSTLVQRHARAPERCL